MTAQDQSLKSLLRDLIDEVGRLIRQELRLAQAEASEKVTQVQTGAVSIVAGLLIAFSALLILLQALVIALANVVPAWLAAVIVGVVLALIAFALIQQGQSSLRASSLRPERTMKSVTESKDMVMEKVR